MRSDPTSHQEGPNTCNVMWERRPAIGQMTSRLPDGFGGIGPLHVSPWCVMPAMRSPMQDQLSSHSRMSRSSGALSRTEHGDEGGVEAAAEGVEAAGHARAAQNDGDLSTHLVEVERLEQLAGEGSGRQARPRLSSKPLIAMTGTGWGC